MQTQKWVNLALMLAAAALFLFLSQLMSTVWGMAHLPVNEDWPVEPSQLLAFGISVATFLWVRRYQRANVFFNEVAVEMTKVTWPERKDTVSATGVVIVLVAICAVLLFAMDSVWRVVIKGLLSL